MNRAHNSMDPEKLRNWTLLFIAILGVPVTLLTFIKLWRETLKTKNEQETALIVVESVFSIGLLFAVGFFASQTLYFTLIGGFFAVIWRVTRFTFSSRPLLRAEIGYLVMYISLCIFSVGEAFAMHVHRISNARSSEIERRLERLTKSEATTNSPPVLQ